MKYVYKFTNGRKLTKSEFIKWFQKKFLYINRKFKMIKKNDLIGFENKGDFRGVVLENLLKIYAEKSIVELFKLPTNKKITKIAIPITLDIEADKAIHILIKGNSKKLNQLSPVQRKIIRPLYLCSDEEVLLYAKLMKLNFKVKKEKTDEIAKFIEGLEKKHPEVKRAIVNSFLGLCS